MVIEMSEQKLVTLSQLRQFLEGTAEVEFRGCGRDEDRYRHIEQMLSNRMEHTGPPEPEPADARQAESAEPDESPSLTGAIWGVIRRAVASAAGAQGEK